MTSVEPARQRLRENQREAADSRATTGPRSGAGQVDVVPVPGLLVDAGRVRESGGRPSAHASAGLRPGVIRRLQIVDLETGEELAPLTIQELLDWLPPAVKRALARLPRAILDGLARLDPEAQRTLLGWPPAAQLAMIAGLEALFAPGASGGGPDEPDGPAPDGPRPTAALVAIGGSGPAQPRLPPDLVDFLLGRGERPGWFGSVHVPAPRTAGRRPLPQLTGGTPTTGPVDGPTLPPARIVLPPASESQLRQQNRERFGQHLATGYERPVPSGTPVTAAPEVGTFVDRHLEKVAERQWREDSAQAYGAQARATATQTHEQQVEAARVTAKADRDAYDLLPANVRKRKGTVKPKPAPHIPVPDLDAVDRQARAEWLADLDALRGHRLDRVTIDGLVAEIGAPELHDALAANGAAMLARLANVLTPQQVSQLLDAAPHGKVPAALTDAVATALPGVLAAGGSADLILGGLSSLGPQLAVLLQHPAAPCVRLLRLPKLGLLKTMLAGGQAANLVTLIGRATVSIDMVNALMVAVDTPATLGLVCGTGAANVELLLGAGLGPATLQVWCRPAAVTVTIALLNHPGLATCAPILTDLEQAQPAVQPGQLMAALTAGAAPATVVGAVTNAPGLLQTVAQALQYFTAHPADTLGAYHTSVASAASRNASLRPTNLGTAYAASGAPYTNWQHHAVLTAAILQMLLTEGYAQFAYGSTFKTLTESFSGGDTEEYLVQTWDPPAAPAQPGAWRCRWVLHIHRKKGDSKQDAPIAAHLKRFEQRTLKTATRIPVGSGLAAQARLTNPT
jgi:hypothetical protein